MNDTRGNIISGLDAAWAATMLFIPKFLMFLVILVAGYFLAKLFARLVNALLERLNFDRLVERGFVTKTLQKSGYDASDILAKVVFYAVFLLVLQLAFGVFGPNAISDLLTQIVAFLPRIFVALVILVVASAIAAAVKEVVRVSLGALSYGKMLANLAAVTIWAIGIFAALDQLQIAPAIVNGLFYGMLAIIVGSTVIAVGGGGIVPMRAVWERALGKIEQEAPKIRAEAEQAAPRVAALQERVETDSEQRRWATSP
jgi:hypothetical protein